MKASTKFRKDSEGTVADLAERLKSDPSLAEKIPPIEIMSYKGKTYSANNKRLKAFQMADVPVPTIPASKQSANVIKTRVDGKK